VTDPDANAPPKPTAEEAAPAPEEAAPADTGDAAPPAHAATTTPSETPPTGDPLFDALWAKVLAGWEDDKVHGAILEYSVGAERLPDLAGHYRALSEDPTKGLRAKKRLDAIVIAATQMMMSMKTTPATTVPLSITLTVAGLFACAVAFVAYAMMHR
jgi:hypothetical protein